MDSNNSSKPTQCLSPPPSVPLPTIQSETWLVHAKVREPSEPPGSYELSWLFPLKQGREAESSYEPGGSDVARELSRNQPCFRLDCRERHWLKHPKLFFPCLALLSGCLLNVSTCHDSWPPDTSTARLKYIVPNFPAGFPHGLAQRHIQTSHHRHWRSTRSTAAQSLHPPPHPRLNTVCGL